MGHLWKRDSGWPDWKEFVASEEEGEGMPMTPKHFLHQMRIFFA